MAEKPRKTTVVAFKVEEELATFLNQLPNKSDFIRKAVYSQLGVACPLCTGNGRVSKAVHDHFTAFLEKFELHQCECCGDEFALYRDPNEAPKSMADLIKSAKEEGREVCMPCFQGDCEHEIGAEPHHDHNHPGTDCSNPTKE